MYEAALSGKDNDNGIGHSEERAVLIGACRHKPVGLCILQMHDRAED